jgi:hypothetical protein
MVYGQPMSVVALVALSVVVAQTPAPGPVAEQSGRGATPAVADAHAAAVGVPGAAVIPPLPSDDELQRLATQDIGAARAPLRRAARTAASARTRILALRLLAANDAGSATARICSRALRADVDALVRRGAAECLGRLGSRFGAPQTATLVGALDDPALDVVTMTGWALAAVGDAGAVTALAARVNHPDARVATLFRGYVARLKDRYSLVPSPVAVAPGLGGGAATPPPALPSGGSAGDAAAPTAAPPGVALTFPARNVDTAAATAWLGLYGGMAGWFHGTLLVAAHGGPEGAEVASLGGLGASALGAAAMSGYAYAAAESLPRAHTVVQLGTLGALAGFGAGQLVGFPPVSAVASANLSAVGTLAGMGLGMAFVARNEPTMGALAAGVAATLATGTAGAVLTSSYGYPMNQTLGAMLVTGSVAGIATTTLLARADIGLFPAAGATVGSLVVGGAGAFLMSLIEQGLVAGRPQTEATGWVVLSSITVGAALGGAAGMLVPADLDPLRAGTLRLQPPTMAILPGAGIRPTPTAMAMIGGSFG